MTAVTDSIQSRLHELVGEQVTVKMWNKDDNQIIMDSPMTCEIKGKLRFINKRCINETDFYQYGIEENYSEVPIVYMDFYDIVVADVDMIENRIDIDVQC